MTCTAGKAHAAVTRDVAPGVPQGEGDLGDQNFDSRPSTHKARTLGTQAV